MRASTRVHMNPAADCRGSPSDSAKASCGYKLASLAKLPLALFSFNGLPSLDEKVVKLTAGSSVAGCAPPSAAHRFHIRPCRQFIRRARQGFNLNAAEDYTQRELVWNIFPPLFIPLPLSLIVMLMMRPIDRWHKAIGFGSFFHFD